MSNIDAIAISTPNLDSKAMALKVLRERLAEAGLAPEPGFLEILEELDDEELAEELGQLALDVATSTGQTDLNRTPWESEGAGYRRRITLQLVDVLREMSIEVVDEQELVERCADMGFNEFFGGFDYALGGGFDTEH